MAQHQNTWRDFSQIGLFAYKWENNAKMVMFLRFVITVQRLAGPDDRCSYLQ